MKIMIARKKIHNRKRIEKQKLAERQVQQFNRVLAENMGAKV